MNEELMNANNKSIEDRVTHMERMVDSMRSDLTGVKTDLALLIGKIGPMTDAIGKLDNRLNIPANPTPWPAIISAVATVLVLLGGIGYSNLDPIRDLAVMNSHKLGTLNAAVFEQATEQSEIIEKAARNEKATARLELRMDSTRDLSVANNARLDTVEQTLRAREAAKIIKSDEY